MRSSNISILERSFCPVIDPKLLKENPQLLYEMLDKRKSNFPLEDLIILDKKRRELIIKSQEIRHRKNILSQQISKKKKSGLDILGELRGMEEIGTKMENLNLLTSSTKESFDQLMFMIPNLMDDSVPEGKDSNDNTVLRTVGNIGKKNIQYLDHVDLCKSLDLVDLDR